MKKIIAIVIIILVMMSACTTKASAPYNFNLVESTGIYYVVKDSRTNCEYLAQDGAAFIVVEGSCKTREAK